MRVEREVGEIAASPQEREPQQEAHNQPQPEMIAAFGWVCLGELHERASYYVYLSRTYRLSTGLALVSLPKLFARAVLVKELRQQALPSAHAKGSLQFPCGLSVRTTVKASGLHAHGPFGIHTFPARCQ